LRRQKRHKSRLRKQNVIGRRNEASKYVEIRRGIRVDHRHHSDELCNGEKFEGRSGGAWIYQQGVILGNHLSWWPFSVDVGQSGRICKQGDTRIHTREWVRGGGGNAYVEV
jgi:hypothetical protein